MLRHDNMAIAIRGRLPNRTANAAAYLMTTGAPSGITHRNMKTVTIRALTGDPDQGTETNPIIEVRGARATAEQTGARKTETEQRSETGKIAQHKHEEAGGGPRIDNSDSYR